jgi:hypothetical protein
VIHISLRFHDKSRQVIRPFAQSFSVLQMVTPLRKLGELRCARSVFFALHMCLSIQVCGKQAAAAGGSEGGGGGEDGTRIKPSNKATPAAAAATLAQAPSQHKSEICVKVRSTRGPPATYSEQELSVLKDYVAVPRSLSSLLSSMASTFADCVASSSATFACSQAASLTFGPRGAVPFSCL